VKDKPLASNMSTALMMDLCCWGPCWSFANHFLFLFLSFFLQIMLLFHYQERNNFILQIWNAIKI